MYEETRGMNRREFLICSGSAIGFVLPPAVASGAEAQVAVLVDPSDRLAKSTPVEWARQQLISAAQARGIQVSQINSLTQAQASQLTIAITGHDHQLARQVLQQAGKSMLAKPESLALARGQIDGKPVLLASGRDERGLVYAVLEIADRLAYATDTEAALAFPRPVVEEPANRVRSITRYFESDVEDKEWFWDRKFWGSYLDMLVTQRLNRFSLAFGLGYNRPRQVRDAYFYFAYPFLLKVPGYNVRVRGLPDEERERNLQTVKWIGEQITRRGLHFQLAIWTHAYQWIDSPEANHVIDGLTPETHAAYCRDAIQLLLQEVPTIKGVTIRAHSESGIPEGSYDFWQQVFEGIRRAGRTVEIDIHSKGIEHKLLKMARATGNPVTVSPKYWAEHMGLPYHQAAIREEERVPRGDPSRIEVQRRFTRYGYADYLRVDRDFGVMYRIWPGTQRFLLWGSPPIAGGYGRYSHFCDSDGLEISEPLSFKGRMGSGRPGGRNAYADPSLKPKGGDWKKHAYTYRVWGRLLYNPDADPDAWRRQLRREFGPAALHCEIALARVSRVLPLVTVVHHVSASNNGYWPEIYTNIPTVEERRFNRTTTLDPAMFTTPEEFVDELLKLKPSGRYSPLDAARWLEADATVGRRHLEKAKKKVSNPQAPEFRRWYIDTAVQAELGRFFAERFRAGVAYEIYYRTGRKDLLDRAISHYRNAIDAWKQVIQLTDGVYVDDITYGLTPHLRGHWKDRLPAMERDLAAMEQLRVSDGAPAPTAVELPPTIDLDGLFTAAPPQRPRCEHEPPPGFRRGSEVVIETTIEQAYRVSEVALHYRHVNQAEAYEKATMQPVAESKYRAVIPQSYTDGPNHLEYFFVVRGVDGSAWIYPGFRPDLCNQPYYVIHQLKS